MISATPFGHVPVLYVDDGKLVLPETLAIYRYLAAKHGALPDSLEGQALADAYGNHAQDYMSKLIIFVVSIFQKKPREQILENRENFVNFYNDRLALDFKKQLEKNGTGWMIGDRPTWIDFMIADITDSHFYWREETEREIPEELVRHRDKVFGLPGLEKRVEGRKYLFSPKEKFKF